VSHETEALRHELRAAQAEIESLKLRLSNVMYLLKQEMTVSGKLPKLQSRDRTNSATGV
jgi:hypothetical protein